MNIFSMLVFVVVILLENQILLSYMFQAIIFLLYFIILILNAIQFSLNKLMKIRFHNRFQYY